MIYMTKAIPESKEDRFVLNRVRVLFGTKEKADEFIRDWEETRLDLLKKLPKDHPIYLVSEE